MKKIRRPTTLGPPPTSFARGLTGIAASVALGSLGTTGGSSKAVLTPDDFTYLGMFKIPNDPGGTRFGFSNGAITGRRVDGTGTLTFFICGSSVWPQLDEVYEISYPGYGASFAAAPYTSVVRVWGDVYQSKKVTNNGNLPNTRGLMWANNQLWWAYGDLYNAGSVAHDPSIGTTVLNDSTGGVTAYGPWRTQEHSQMTRGYMVTIPSWFSSYVDGKIMAVGAPITSGNAGSSWGAGLHPLDLPNNSAPADTIGSTHITIPSTRLVYHDINNRQGRDSNFKYCFWNEPYNNAAGGYTVPGAPYFTSIDMMSAAAWIDTPTKSGVVYFGQLATTIPGWPYADGDTQTHWWYGPSHCVHGQDGGLYNQSTGDTTSTMAKYVWIYDPADLQAVAEGGDPTAIEPTSFGPITDYAPSEYLAGIYPVANKLYQFGGAYWDPVGSLLFLCETNQDGTTNGFEPRPIVHVFSIG